MRRTELDFMGVACEFFCYFLPTQKVVHNLATYPKQCGFN